MVATNATTIEAVAVAANPLPSSPYPVKIAEMQQRTSSYDFSSMTLNE